jgi:hypothetical protein
MSEGSDISVLYREFADALTEVLAENAVGPARRGRLARARATVKKHPNCSDAGYLRAVEAAFENWEAMQKAGRLVYQIPAEGEDPQWRSPTLLRRFPTWTIAPNCAARLSPVRSARRSKGTIFCSTARWPRSSLLSCISPRPIRYPITSYRQRVVLLTPPFPVCDMVVCASGRQDEQSPFGRFGEWRKQ